MKILKILIVEDDPAIPNFIKGVIKRELVADFLTATTLTQFNNHLNNSNFIDVIVLDGMLGNDNTLEATRRAHELYPSCLLIAISSNLQPEQLKAGCMICIDKATELSQIGLVIKHALGLKD